MAAAQASRCSAENNGINPKTSDSKKTKFAELLTPIYAPSGQLKAIGMPHLCLQD